MKPSILEIFEKVYGLRQRKKTEVMPISKVMFPFRIVDLLISGNRFFNWLLKHFPSTGKQPDETTDASHFNQVFHYCSFFFIHWFQWTNIPVFLTPFWRLGKPLSFSKWWKNIFVLENFMWLEYFGFWVLMQHLSSVTLLAGLLC